jgi:hypothetical protein
MHMQLCKLCEIKEIQVIQSVLVISFLKGWLREKGSHKKKIPATILKSHQNMAAGSFPSTNRK